LSPEESAGRDAGLRRRDAGFGEAAVMARTGTRKNRWLIYLVGKRGMLGGVEAPGSRLSHPAAIMKFAIANPERKKRLIARRWT
jgi:hypothetical protein